MSDSSKERQHYVQCKYLQKWADKDTRSGRVLVNSKDEKVKNKPIGVNDLCVEGYFYDASSLTEVDIFLMNLITKDLRVSNSRMEFTNEMLEELKKSKDFVEKNVASKIENINNLYCFIDRMIEGDTSFYKDTQLVSLYKQVLFHLNTALYGDKVDNEKLKSIQEDFNNRKEEDNTKFDFLLFFYYQYFRTKRNRDLLVSIYSNFIKVNPQFNKCNLNNVAILNYIKMSYVTAYNTDLMNTHIVIYKNRSDVKYVTADCPIAPIKLSTGNSAYIYPLSPECLVKLNLWMGDNKVLEATENEVNQFNTIISDLALNQIYSKFNVD